MSKQCASAGSTKCSRGKASPLTTDSALMHAHSGECEGYIGEKSPACVFECAFEKFSLRLLLFSAAKLLLTVCVRRWLSQLMMPFSVRP